MLQSSCAYIAIFETAAAHVSDGGYQLSDYPRPFIIEPPLPAPRLIEKGESFACHLIIMGPALNYLPYFVYAFTKLGQTGLGQSRGRYRLKNIESALKTDNRIIFDGATQQFCNSPETYSFDTFLNKPSDSDELCLTFQTPTRIKYKNHLTKTLAFDLLMKNLMRRLSLLGHVCNEVPLNPDYHGLLKLARTVRLKTSALYWYDWRRYSSRQNTAMQLGGFMGTVTFQGDFTPFMPYIRLGSYLHVGKACTFGLGKYILHARD